MNCRLTWRLSPWALATSKVKDALASSLAADSVSGDAGERKPLRLAKSPREARVPSEPAAASGEAAAKTEGPETGAAAPGADRSMGWWNWSRTKTCTVTGADASRSWTEVTCWSPCCSACREEKGRARDGRVTESEAREEEKGRGGGGGEEDDISSYKQPRPTPGKRGRGGKVSGEEAARDLNVELRGHWGRFPAALDL